MKPKMTVKCFAIISGDRGREKGNKRILPKYKAFSTTFLKH